MPDPISLKTPTISRQLDRRLPLQNPMDGTKNLIDHLVKLKDKRGEIRELVGFVPEGIDENNATRMVVEQNSGICIIECGKYDSVYKVDTSKLEWITLIVLNDGTTIKNPHIGTYDGRSLEIGKVKDHKFWENGQTRRVTRENKKVLIEDGSDFNGALPSLKGGGCSGAITQDDIDHLVQIIDLIAQGQVQKETYLFDRETEEIIKKEEFWTPQLLDFSCSDGSAIGCRVLNQQNLPSTFTDSFIPNRIFDAPRPEDLTYVLRKMMEVEQKSGHDEHGFNDSFDGGTTPGFNSMMMPERITQNPDTTDHGHLLPPGDGSAKPFEIPPRVIELKDVIVQDAKAADIKLEESIIMRLLMNPVERKLWGRLYGLPGYELRELTQERQLGSKIPDYHAQTVSNYERIPHRSYTKTTTITKIDEDRTPKDEPKTPLAFKFGGKVGVTKAEAKKSYGDYAYGPSSRYVSSAKEQRGLKIEDQKKEDGKELEIDQAARLLDLMQRLKLQVKPRKSRKRKSNEDKSDFDKPPKSGTARKVRAKKQKTEKRKELKVREIEKPKKQTRRILKKMEKPDAGKMPKPGGSQTKKKVVSEERKLPKRTKIAKSLPVEKPKSSKRTKKTEKTVFRTSKKEVKESKKPETRIILTNRTAKHSVTFSSPFQTAPRKMTAEKRRGIDADFRLSWIIGNVKQRKRFKTKTG